MSGSVPKVRRIAQPDGEARAEDGPAIVRPPAAVHDAGDESMRYSGRAGQCEPTVTSNPLRRVAGEGDVHRWRLTHKPIEAHSSWCKLQKSSPLGEGSASGNCLGIAAARAGLRIGRRAYIDLCATRPAVH
jgi:hypothetical protein